MSFRRPIPPWARRRAREREAEANERFNARLATLINAVTVDVVWSNDTMRPYHQRCRAFIPPGQKGTVDMGLLAEVADACAHCGRPLDDEGQPMTMNEAKERVSKIWGGNRLISVIRQHDGTIDVNLLPAGIASDTRARNYAAHRLDANGHVVCHDDCKALEP